MHESTISVKSPGKLILLGEYAVLEQAPALVTAVDRQCKVDIAPLYNSTFQISTPNLKLPNVQFTLDTDGDAHFRTPLLPKVEKQLRFVLSILKYVTRRYGRIPGASIEIDTTPFYHRTTGHKFGLGSSAALTVSLLSALMEYMNMRIARPELYRESYLAHRHAQGKLGSGTDIAASSIGGVMSYVMPNDISKLNGQTRSLNWPGDLHMVTIWAGYSASTRHFVRRIQRFRDEHPNHYQTLMKPLIDLSEQGSREFDSGNSDAFLEIVSDFMDRERELGKASNTEIISDVHEEISSLVKQAGGTYKPSGAGGGDIGVAFCKSMNEVEQIRRVIDDSMYDLMDIQMQNKGVQILHSYEMS